MTRAVSSAPYPTHTMTLIFIRMATQGIHMGQYCPLANGKDTYCMSGCCPDKDGGCCGHEYTIAVVCTVLSIVIVGIALSLCICCCCVAWKKRRPRGRSLDDFQQGTNHGSSHIEYGEFTAAGSPDDLLGVSNNQNSQPAVETRVFPPGCYAPPPYSSVVRNSSFVRPISIPISPPPYDSASTGHNDKAPASSD